LPASFSTLGAATAYCAVRKAAIPAIVMFLFIAISIDGLIEISLRSIALPPADVWMNAQMKMLYLLHSVLKKTQQ
jgi:hypothetical protein